MSDLLKKIKVPIIIIVILIISFVVYNLFFKKTQDDSGISKGETSEETIKSPNEDFLPLLNLIRNVSFNENLFKDPVFRSLADFSEPVKEEQKGRVNPFDPNISASAFLSNTDISFAGSEVVDKKDSAGTSTPSSVSTSTTSVKSGGN